MTRNPNIITERQKIVIETMRMKLSEKFAMVYLEKAGYKMHPATWYREKNKVEKLKLKRLYHIAQIGFQDQHLETIDQYELGFKMMWQNVLRERDPYKQNQMIKDILLLKPYLSSYYEATKLIIEKQPQVVNENESNQEQERESNSISPYARGNETIISRNQTTGTTDSISNMVPRDLDESEAVF